MARRSKPRSDYCRKSGCNNLAINGYCSKEHAPFGNMVDDQKQMQASPIEWVDTFIGIKEIANNNCTHGTQDPYICAARKIRTTRFKINFDNRCLCSCHVIDQLEHFEEDL